MKDEEEEGPKFDRNGRPKNPFWPFTEKGEGIEEAVIREIREITNLNNAGPGSARDALEGGDERDGRDRESDSAISGGEWVASSDSGMADRRRTGRDR